MFIRVYWRINLKKAVNHDNSLAAPSLSFTICVARPLLETRLPDLEAVRTEHAQTVEHGLFFCIAVQINGKTCIWSESGLTASKIAVITSLNYFHRQPVFSTHFSTVFKSTLAAAV